MPETLSKYGVPLGNGERKPILQPLSAYRFRVVDCPDEITANTEVVLINMVKKTITMDVRCTVLAESMIAALKFASSRMFTIELLDGTTVPLYGLSPMGLKLVDHQFKLDYKDSSYAVHHYEWSFESLETLVDEKTADRLNDMIPFKGGKPDPNFPTVQEAMDQLKGAVDTQNENIKKGLTGGRQLLNETDDDIGDPRTAGC